MGMIGRWIDEKCRTEPDVMRRVLNRKFGQLTHWIGADNKCGCLVGSWAIERGDYRPAQSLGLEIPEIAIGCRVCAVGERRGGPMTIRLIKQRIRKSLGLAPREVLMGADHSSTGRET